MYYILLIFCLLIESISVAEAQVVAPAPGSATGPSIHNHNNYNGFYNVHQAPHDHASQHEIPHYDAYNLDNHVTSTQPQTQEQTATDEIRPISFEISHAQTPLDDQTKDRKSFTQRIHEVLLLILERFNLN